VLLRALGADVDVVPSIEGPPHVTSQHIQNMIARAEELARRPGHLCLQAEGEGFEPSMDLTGP
jgi:hypothetical protein